MNSEIQLETEISPSTKNTDRITKFLIEHWHATLIASKGGVIDATKISRVLALTPDGQLAGLATFEVNHADHSCELVSINAIARGQGLGTRLLHAVEQSAKAAGTHRLWLVTTNDRPEAAAFYIKRGYRLIAIHLDAIAALRKLKPQIPLHDHRGLPLRDEWEFEKELA